MWILFEVDMVMVVIVVKQVVEMVKMMVAVSYTHLRAHET